MKPLILVKHSEPVIVEHVPAREWVLSERGRRRAAELAALLPDSQPEAIICSVEPKARETAEILAGKLALPFQTHMGLHEHDRSNSPYYSRDEFRALVQEFFFKPNALVFGTETAEQASTRFSAAIDSVLDTYTGKSVVIVSHGTVISLFAAKLTGCNGYLLWQQLGLPSFVILDLQSKLLLETRNLP